MKKCLVPNCEEKHCAKGLCNSHYCQMKRGVRIEEMVSFKKRTRKYNQGKICNVEGCNRKAERALMCMAHYQRVQKYKDPLTDKPVGERKGWHRHKTGYIVVPAYGHPNGNKAGSIMEHIKIMSFSIGRALTKEENVHHKNGIRDDNRIENLELWTKSHPSGSRVRDLIKYSKEIIKIYGENEEKY